jgi:hypothetical protein
MVMTSYGCQKCPSEEVISPLRNVAITIGMVVVLVLWFWYSWSPFFPSVGAFMNSIVILLSLYDDSTESSDKASTLSELLVIFMVAVEKFRIIQYSKIFISYLQVMSSFVEFHVNWPPAILNAMLWCKVTFNFSLLSMPGVSCLWRGLDYNTKLVSYTIIPVGLGVMLFLPLLIVFLLDWFPRSSENQILFMRTSVVIKDRCWNAVMFVCFLVRKPSQ